MMPPTLTIVTGDPRSGKLLVGDALADRITRTQSKLAVVVTESTSASSLRYATYSEGNPSLPDPKDILLVASGPTPEPWMAPWLERYGPALFTIHITRHDLQEKGPEHEQQRRSDQHQGLA